MQITEVKKPKARYRSMFISILLFLLLIVGILGLNLYSSFQISKDNAAINTATKMRDTVQAINRDLLNLKLSYGEDVFSPNIDSSIKRVKQNAVFFTKGLNAFKQGGKVSGQGVDATLEALTSVTSVAALDEISAEWQSFAPSINAYTDVAQDINSDATTLDLAVNQAQGSGVIVYNDMEKIVQEVKNTAESRANLLKIIQLAGIAVIILYFLIFVFFFLRRLRASDALADEARKETDDILNTVDSGLFLLDKDLNIGSQHSKELERILLKGDLANKKLADLLLGIVSQKDVEVTADFIEQLYNPRVKTKLINDLNPLKKIKVSLDDGNVSKEKFLDFNFSRIYRGSDISHILVSVNDITEQINAELRLVEERRQNEEQMQMINSILNADSFMLNDFVSGAKAKTNRINDVLKDSKKGTNILQNKLADIFREAHSLKGDASALGLAFLSSRITDFEDVIKDLQFRSNLAGDDFLPLTVRLDEIIDQIQTIENLSTRLNVATGNTTMLSSTAVNQQVMSGENVQPQSNEPMPNDMQQQSTTDMLLGLHDTQVRPSLDSMQALNHDGVSQQGLAQKDNADSKQVGVGMAGLATGAVLGNAIVANQGLQQAQSPEVQPLPTVDLVTPLDQQTASVPVIPEQGYVEPVVQQSELLSQQDANDSLWAQFDNQTASSTSQQNQSTHAVQPNVEQINHAQFNQADLNQPIVEAPAANTVVNQASSLEQPVLPQSEPAIQPLAAMSPATETLQTQNQLGNALPSMAAGIASTAAEPLVANSDVSSQVPASSYYGNFVSELAYRNGKRAELIATDITGLERGQSDKHRLLREITIQLLRNSVTHGIEEPSVRLANFKADTGQIKLNYEETPENISISVEDDGRGIDYDAIKEKAIKLHFGAPEEVATWSNRKLLSLIFDSGFSTADKVTDDAGQGVGLDLVKERVKQLSAKMKVDTEFGKYTRFTVVCKK